MNSTKVLYYPYASISNINMVKRAILYFDQINLLDPRDANTDDPTQKTDNEWEQLRKELYQSKLINPIHPKDYIKDDFKVISDNILHDLNSKEFLKLCEPYLDVKWKISKSKIP